MPDQIVKETFFGPIIKCGTCGTDWGYLQDQTQCTKCCRRPNISELRNLPKTSLPKTPQFCPDCHAVEKYWDQCGDCNRK